ncbi:UNVERIFIED_CONTAM: hypothetical protein NCL1_32372 [Trichonephila clavipes]
MSPYNAYSSSLSSSRLSSYTPTPRSYTGSDSYSSLSSTYNYRYKPPAYSSTLSLKYRSPSSYSLNHSYTPSTLPRNASSSSFAARVPKFNSVSSYTSAILNASDSNWKSSIANDWLGRSPSLSRRNSSSSLVSSSHASERNSRLSLPAYTSSVEKLSVSLKYLSFSREQGRLFLSQLCKGKSVSQALGLIESWAHPRCGVYVTPLQLSDIYECTTKNPN